MGSTRSRPCSARAAWRPSTRRGPASVNRDVAIKVIESKLARRSEFLKRFQREAQTVAAMATLWTATPTPTASLTPSDTPTVTATPTATRTSTPIPAGAKRIDGRGIKQVWLPAGCFKMGSDKAKDKDARNDEQPQHEVCITQSYWIGAYEVTNGDYQKSIDDGGYTKQIYWSADGRQWKQNITGPADYTGFTDPKQPRIGVSWYEADAYARWRGGRLPSEAEWEYAARGRSH